MSACEKCWRESQQNQMHGAGPTYAELVASRRANPCTPEEQAGPGAVKCPRCERMTLHQFTREPMCGCAAVHGISCRKAWHKPDDGALHGPDDDAAYDVDGVRYCGRCHEWMPR